MPNVGTFDWSSIAVPFSHITISLKRIKCFVCRVNLIKGDLNVLILRQLIGKIRSELRVNLLLPLAHHSKLNVDALDYSVVRHVIIEAKLLIQILLNLQVIKGVNSSLHEQYISLKSHVCVLNHFIDKSVFFCQCCTTFVSSWSNWH